MSHPTSMPSPPRVLISYRIESKDHAERVRALGDQLRRDGVDIVLDRYVPAPADGWSWWMEGELKKAERVIVVCSEAYLKSAARQAEAGQGLGASWEWHLIRREIYDNRGAAKRFIPIMFDRIDKECIPSELWDQSRHCITGPEDDGYRGLLNDLFGLPDVPPPPVGVRPADLAHPRLESARVQSAGTGVRIGASPRVYISYTHDSKEHKAWVAELAERLHYDGVDVTFDYWFMEPGADFWDSINAEVARADVAVLVCTPVYRAKATGRRRGGLKREYDLVVARSKLDPKFKVVPILCKGTWNKAVPPEFAARFGFTLGPDRFESSEYVGLRRALLGGWKPPEPPPAAPAGDLLRHLWERVLQRILTSACKSFARPLEWPALNALFTPPTLAKGLSPRLRQWGFEEVERRRAAGERAPEAEMERRLAVQADPVNQRPNEERRREPWQSVCRDVTRAVILGDPGFGKTVSLLHETGSRCFAALQAGAVTETAVFLKAAEWARHAVPTGPPPAALAGLLEAVITAYDLSPESAGLLEAEIRSGRCLMVIDGLDEVPEELRQGFDDCLGRLSAVPTVRMLLSSRLAGYAVSPLPGATEWEIMPFTLEQVRAACRAWFVGRDDVWSRFWAWVWSRTEFPHLLQSPLLAHLACRAFGEDEAAQPLARRADLYRTFLEHTVQQWEARVGREIALRRGRFKPLAAEVARTLWQPDGRRSVWAEEAVHAAVAAALARCPGPYRGDLYADLLDAGLLVPAGLDRYGTPLAFMHRTIGEYLVATAVAADPNWSDTVREHMFHAGWEEVLPLLAGVLERQDGDEPERRRAAEHVCGLLRAVEHDLLARPLALAVRAVADACRLDRVVVDRLIADLTNLLVYPVERLAPENALSVEGLQSAPAALAAIGEMTIVPIDFIDFNRLDAALVPFCPAVERQLIELLRVPPEAQPTPAADQLWLGIPGLSQFLRHPDYLYARRLPYLVHFGNPKNEESWRILLAALNQPHLYTLATALNAVGTFGAAGPVPEFVLGRLRELLRHPPDFASQMLQPISWIPDERKAREDPIAVRELIANAVVRFEQFPDDLGTEIRASVMREFHAGSVFGAGQLAQLAKRQPASLQQLLADLNDADARIRALAAEALAEVGPLPAEAVARLTQMLRQDPDVLCRGGAAFALAQLVRPTPMDLDVLRAACDDTAPEVRRTAAYALIQLTRDGPAAGDSLRMVLNHFDPEVRAHAVDVLRADDLAGDPALVRSLVEAASNPPRRWASRFAELAGQIAEVAPEQIDRFCEDLKNPAGQGDCLGAAQALAHLKHVTPAILHALWSGLSDPEWAVRAACVDALLSLNRRVSETRAELGRQRQNGATWAGGLLELLGYEPTAWAPRLAAEMDPAQRLLTAETILAFGHPDGAAIAVAEEALAAAEPWQPDRWRWGKLLGQMLGNKPALLGPLVRAMGHPDQSVQSSASATVVTFVTTRGIPLAPASAPSRLRDVHRRLVEMVRPVIDALSRP